MTDEDELIARLEVHRDMIGWLIRKLGLKPRTSRTALCYNRVV